MSYFCNSCGGKIPSLYDTYLTCEKCLNEFGELRKLKKVLEQPKYNHNEIIKLAEKLQLKINFDL